MKLFACFKRKKEFIYDFVVKKLIDEECSELTEIHFFKKEKTVEELILIAEEIRKTKIAWEEKIGRNMTDIIISIYRRF